MFYSCNKKRSSCALREFLLVTQADINPVIASCSYFFILERFYTVQRQAPIKQMFPKQRLKSIFGSIEQWHLTGVFRRISKGIS